MKMSKFARTALIPAVAVIALSGFSLADSADLSTTGPDSNNQVTTDISNHVDINNHNDVTVQNHNSQSAVSGSALVDGNTTAGDALSGTATNSNTTSTAVAINNNQSSQNPEVSGGGQGGGGAGGGVGGSSLSMGNGNPTGKGGGSLSVGGGTLPVTGASLPIDVSALRNALSPVLATPAEAVKANRRVATILLSLAAALSLVGAIGSAVFSTKRTLKV